MFAGFRCGGDGLLACVRELTVICLPHQEARTGRGAAVGRAMEPRWTHGCGQTWHRRLHVLRCARELYGAQGTAARQPASLRVAAQAQLFARSAPGLGSGRVDVFTYAAVHGPQVALWRAWTTFGQYSGSDEDAFTCSRARPLGGRPWGCGRAHRRGPGAARHEVVTTEPSKSG
jgi:hypothetical protein